MSKSLKKIIFLATAVGLLYWPLVSVAQTSDANFSAENVCFCEAKIEKLTPENFKTIQMGQGCPLIDMSVPDPQAECNPKTMGLDPEFFSCRIVDNETACGEQQEQWRKKYEARFGAAVKYENQFGFTGKILPACVLNDNLTDDCKDVSIFVLTLINVGRYLFSIIGGIALLMFIYGGFVMVLSRGNSEQVKKGTGAITAAAVGLVITFGGYMLVKFLSDSLKITNVLN